MEKKTQEEKMDPKKGQQIEQLTQYLEVCERQIEAYSDEHLKLEKAYFEFSKGIETIKALTSGNLDDEILVPIGGGVSISAKVAGKNKVMLSLGADITAETEAEKALEVLEKRQKLIEESSKRVRELIEGYAQQRKNILAQLEALQEKS